MSENGNPGKAPASPSGSGSTSGRSSPPPPVSGSALGDAVARRQQSVDARSQHASGAGSALGSAVAGRADQQARRESLVPPLNLGGGGGGGSAAAAPESPRVFRTMDPGTPRADGRRHLPSKAETGSGAGARVHDNFGDGGGQSAGPSLAGEQRRAQSTTGGAVFSASVREMGERGISAVNDKPGHVSIRANLSPRSGADRGEHNKVFQANRDMWRQETPVFPKPPKKKKNKKPASGSGTPKGSGGPPGKPPGGGRGGRGGGGAPSSAAAVPVK